MCPKKTGSSFGIIAAKGFLPLLLYTKEKKSADQPIPVASAKAAFLPGYADLEQMPASFIIHQTAFPQDCMFPPVLFTFLCDTTVTKAVL